MPKLTIEADDIRGLSRLIDALNIRDRVPRTEVASGAESPQQCLAIRRKKRSDGTWRPTVRCEHTARISRIDQDGFCRQHAQWTERGGTKWEG